MARQAFDHKVILDNLYDGVYLTDLQRRILYWNGGAERISGYTAAEVVGSSCADSILVHVNAEGTNLCQGHCPLAQTLHDGEIRAAEVFLHHKAGHRVPVLVRVAPLKNARGRTVGAVEVFSDNTGAVSARQRLETLETQAMLDPLTDVPNRRYAEMRLQSRLYEWTRFALPLGLIFADVDHFKQVNDVHGHAIGDQALKMVAHTLSHNVRPTDMAARWGGEEFAIILANVDERQLRSSAERLRLLVERSALYEQAGPIRVTVSLGATVAKESDSIDSLVQRADALMYRAKAAGRNCVCVG